MLVLSRKAFERIIIDNTIVITVVEIRSGKVRLGIEAPRDMPITPERDPLCDSTGTAASGKRKEIENADTTTVTEKTRLFERPPFTPT